MSTNEYSTIMSQTISSYMQNIEKYMKYDVIAVLKLASWLNHSFSR